MTANRLPWRTYWPWVLVAVALVLGPLTSCAAPVPQATPTPTKTPRIEAKSPSTTTQPTPSSAPTKAAAPSATTPAQAATPAAASTQAPAKAASPASSSTPARTPTPTAVPAGLSNAMMTSPDSGVQAFLWWRPEVADRDLMLISQAGFHWVKQYFSWQDIEGAGKGQFDWTHTDRIVDQVEAAKLKLIVRLSSNPDRPFWGGNPPENTKDFADFAKAVATRYKGRVQAYQVWNEPNLAREWGNKRPDPAAYSQMLKATYSAIKSVDPAAIIVTAGMAPTTQDDNVAMPDMKFYQGMYDAMGKNSGGYFDMLGAHGTGWAVSPETDPQVVVDSPKLHNNDPSAPELLRVYAFRHIEDIRALMVKNGDAAKRLVILEFGWTTDNRPNSPYYWHGAGAGINEPTQAKYLVRAYQYAAANWQPWIGLMVVIYMPDVTWTKEDEQYWWSLIGPGYPDNYWRAGYIELCIYLNGLNSKRCQYDPNPK